MSQQAVSRNDPCPCGSGLKYKKCHLGKQLEVQRKKNYLWLIVVAAVATVLGIVTWQARDLGTGAGVFIGVAVLGAMFVVFRDPPPPKAGSGDPAGMNFGR